MFLYMLRSDIRFENKRKNLSKNNFNVGKFYVHAVNLSKQQMCCWNFVILKLNSKHILIWFIPVFIVYFHTKSMLAYKMVILKDS